MGDPPKTGGESIADFFGKSGMLPVVLDDARQYPRVYFRTCAEATVYQVGGAGKVRSCFLLTSDLSRGGIGLIHSRPLIPGQKLELLLSGESLDGQQSRTVEVVRCQRTKDGRYVIGCRFTEPVAGQFPGA
jgi:PilZ domain